MVSLRAEVAPLSPEVVGVIAAYTPRRLAPEATAFARAAVSAAAPVTVARAKALLFATSRLGAFGISVGLKARLEILLHPSVIERFILDCEAAVSGPTRRTLRTNLRHVAERVSPAPAPTRLSRERAKRPYTDAQIAAYLALADAQPTTSRRMRAVGLICLGAGAGLLGADLRLVRGSDVVARSGGMVVEVTGRRARVVPVLARYHLSLSEVASFFGSDFVVGGADPARRNVTSPLIASLAGGADLGRLEVGRLRSTWLADVAQAIGLEAFMAAAGVTCTQRLGDVVACLTEPDEATMVALLGGPP